MIKVINAFSKLKKIPASC